MAQLKETFLRASLGFHELNVVLVAKLRVHLDAAITEMQAQASCCCLFPDRRAMAPVRLPLGPLRSVSSSYLRCLRPSFTKATTCATAWVLWVLCLGTWCWTLDRPLLPRSCCLAQTPPSSSR